MKIKFIKPKSVVVLVAIFIAETAPTVIADSTDHRCKHIHGKIETLLTTNDCGSPYLLCTTGATKKSGILSGSTYYTVERLSGDAVDSTLTSSFSYNGYLTINTRHGILMVTDLGILNKAGGTFSELSLSVAGTEALKGATGTLFFYGLASPTGFEGDIAGQICFSKKNDLRSDPE